MIGSWLTTRAVYIFGALLILIGLIFIGNGVPVVRMEIGPAEIIGGAVTASAGCIVIVLGLFLARMELLQATLDRVVVAAPVAIPRAEEATFGAHREREPAGRAEEAPSFVAQRERDPVVRAEPPRYPVVHPLAPAARRDGVELGRTEVRPEPALAIAAAPGEGDEPPPVDPPEAPALTESAPALVHAEEEASHSPAVEPFEPMEATKARPSFMSSMLARRLMAGSLRRPPEPEPAPLEPVLTPTESKLPGLQLRRSVVDLSSGWDEEITEPATPSVDAVQAPPTHPEPGVSEPPQPEPLPARLEREPFPSLAPEPEPPAPEPASVQGAEPAPRTPEPATDQPVVVGRYNAGAASYVMYSNGMIEVETEQGTHQFASMQELKAFIERRDTASAY